MLTGLDPHRHHVPRNGFRFQGKTETLAQRLKTQGYQTVAVVAAAALERDMGLDVGFEVYDDRFSVKHKSMFQDTARVLSGAYSTVGWTRRLEAVVFICAFLRSTRPIDTASRLSDAIRGSERHDATDDPAWTRHAYMTRVKRGGHSRRSCIGRFALSGRGVLYGPLHRGTLQGSTDAGVPR